jgi:hypothetical protein
MSERRDKCPYCGGTAGTVVTETFYRKRYTAWNGSHIDVGNEFLIKDTPPRCEDCDKIVPTFQVKAP